MGGKFHREASVHESMHYGVKTKYVRTTMEARIGMQVRLDEVRTNGACFSVLSEHRSYVGRCGWPCKSARTGFAIQDSAYDILLNRSSVICLPTQDAGEQTTHHLWMWMSSKEFEVLQDPAVVHILQEWLDSFDQAAMEDVVCI